MSESRETNSDLAARRAPRVAGARRRLEPEHQPPERAPLARRARTWIIGVVLAGLATGIGTLVTNAVGGGASVVIHAVAGSTPTASPTPRAVKPVQLEYVGPVDSLPDGSFVLPSSVSLTGAQLAEASRLNWSGSVSDHDQLVASLHAVSPSDGVDDGTVKITMRGAASDTVTITGMDVVKQCGAPLTGTLFYSPPAGESTSIDLGFNLDDPISPAQNEQGGSFSGSFFAGKDITLQTGEVQTLNVTVGTSEHYCTFYFELHVVTETGVVSEKIDDNGKPFAVTAIPVGGANGIDFAAYSTVYVGGVANSDGNAGGAFVQVNPKTYNGMGEPASFPPTP